MIHPHTELRFIDENIGFGVFATARIPKGTITYVIDALEIEIPPTSPMLVNPLYNDVIERYSYIGSEGSRILSWDHAKYVNHSCNSNCLSTGYGFEVAVRDIEPGEQLTDDYGQFNISRPMRCSCGHGGCRHTITPHDHTGLADDWDRRVQSALFVLNNVNQPLITFLDARTHRELKHYLKKGERYHSVRELIYLQNTPEEIEAGVYSEPAATADMDLEEAHSTN